MSDEHGAFTVLRGYKMREIYRLVLRVNLLSIRTSTSPPALEIITLVV